MFKSSDLQILVALESEVFPEVMTLMVLGVEAGRTLLKEILKSKSLPHVLNITAKLLEEIVIRE